MKLKYAMWIGNGKRPLKASSKLFLHMQMKNVKIYLDTL